MLPSAKSTVSAVSAAEASASEASAFFRPEPICANHCANLPLANSSQITTRTARNNPVPIFPERFWQSLTNSAPAKPPSPPPKQVSEETSPEKYERTNENSGAAVIISTAGRRKEESSFCRKILTASIPRSTTTAKAERPKQPPTRNRDQRSPNRAPEFAGILSGLEMSPHETML